MGFESVSALTTIPSSNNNTTTVTNNTTTDKEYQQIQNILKQLGLIPTGDKDTDKSTLEKLVLEAQRQVANQNEISRAQSGQAWSFIMTDLGIPQTGDPIEDRQLIETQINLQLQNNNLSQERQAYYSELKGRLDYYFNQGDDNAIKKSLESFFGASLLADINRVMLVQT